MRSLATSPDTRTTSAPGESRNAHFSSAVSSADDQRAIMRMVFRGRREDKLSYGGDEAEDFE